MSKDGIWRGLGVFSRNVFVGRDFKKSPSLFFPSSRRISLRKPKLRSFFSLSISQPFLHPQQPIPDSGDSQGISGIVPGSCCREELAPAISQALRPAAFSLFPVVFILLVSSLSVAVQLCRFKLLVQPSSSSSCCCLEGFTGCFSGDCKGGCSHLRLPSPPPGESLPSSRLDYLNTALHADLDVSLPVFPAVSRLPTVGQVYRRPAGYFPASSSAPCLLLSRDSHTGDRTSPSFLSCRRLVLLRQPAPPFSFLSAVIGGELPDKGGSGDNQDQPLSSLLFLFPRLLSLETKPFLKIPTSERNHNKSCACCCSRRKQRLFLNSKERKAVMTYLIGEIIIWTAKTCFLNSKERKAAPLLN